jgi:hypothetical protein
VNKKNSLFVIRICIHRVFLPSNRQIQAFDLAAFEDSALDDTADIIARFKRKKHRIVNIFRTSDSEETDVS